MVIEKSSHLKYLSIVSSFRVNRIKIQFTGLDALINFKFEDDKHEIFTKYLTSEMLKKGFLAKNSIYVSTSHSERLIKKYLYNLENIFINLGKLEIIGAIF